MEDIKEYLEDNNFEIISQNTNEVLISYKFDLVELDAARAFVNEEDILEENKEGEYQDYLKEIASDNLEDTLDEIFEELDIELSFEARDFIENKQIFAIKK